MNPILIVLAIVMAVAIWFFGSFLFRPIGKLFYRLWEDAEEAINYEEEENKNTKE